MNYGKNAVKRREKKLDAKGKKIRKKFSVFLGKAILICLMLLAVIGISSGIGVWKGIVDSSPDISALDVTPTGFSTTVYSEDGQEIATLVASGANRKYATIDEVPIDLQHAFVAIEDSRFYEHNGIDPKGILRAFFVGLAKGGNFTQGASTITQQLIKNSVLEEIWSTELTGKTSKIEKVQRKVQEQYLAVQLEKQVNSKDWILENYMNTINLGSNTLGIQAASLRYFGKNVSDLTLSECAVIAGITKNPSAYNPISHPDKNDERRKLVLDAMLKEEYISQAEYDAALKDDVYSRIAEHNTILAEDDNTNSYFVDALIDDIFDDLVALGYTDSEAYKMIYRGGLSIYSTQDLSIQKICDEEANNRDNYPTDPRYSFNLNFQVQKADGSIKNYSNLTMLYYYQKHNADYNIVFSTEEKCYEAIAQYEQDVLEEGDVFLEDSEIVSITLQPQVAMTVIEQSTGEVKALVGGRGDKLGNRTLNRATDTPRQPGSCFKIIGCYAAALDAGNMTLASVQDNAPYTIDEKTYRNYNDSYTGYTTIRQAIAGSINIVTVKTLEQIGVNLGFYYAQEFGFTTLCDDDKNLSLSLGGLTHGVTNLELTAAYAAIANEGMYMEPKFYSIVYDHDGNILLDCTENQEVHRVIKETTAWLLTDAMKDVLTSGTGTRAYFGNSMAQAGKSGTTTNNRDALFAGYTPYYTCVVWGGNDDNSIQNDKHTQYPKNIWRETMKRIHEDLEFKDFEKPDGIIRTTLCNQSGLRPIIGVCDADPRGSCLIAEYVDAENLLGENYEAYLAGETSGDGQYASVNSVLEQTLGYCNHHVAVSICPDSGYIAGSGCPAPQAGIFLVGLTEGSTAFPMSLTPEFLATPCPVHGGGYIPEQYNAIIDTMNQYN